MTVFLKFPDEATFVSLLPTDVSPQSEISHDGLCVSVLGIIYTNAPTPIPDGFVAPAGTIYSDDTDTVPLYIPQDGYHVNAIGVLPESWAPYIINVNNPQRIFG